MFISHIYFTHFIFNSFLNAEKYLRSSFGYVFDQLIFYDINKIILNFLLLKSSIINLQFLKNNNKRNFKKYIYYF